MDKQQGITYVDDNKLIGAINNACHRITFVSPGVSVSVAAALSAAWKRLGAEAVTVILDVDPEVCRLGYGTSEGLTLLRNAASSMGTMVCQQPGIRIGLLISDESTFIYSPTPLLVEAGSSTPEHPNAIVLNALPHEIAKDIGLGDNPNLDRVIGLDPVTPDQIVKLEKDLAAAPPQKFDLARRVRVFTSRFQFVELEMNGCYISRKRVCIPNKLMGLSKNDPADSRKEKDIKERLQTHFNLASNEGLVVTNGDDRLTEKSLDEEKRRIVAEHFVLLKGYGNAILKSNKEKFMKDVEALKENVEKFQKGIVSALQKQIDENVAAVVEILLPMNIQNPPQGYGKIHGTDRSEGTMRSFLKAEINGLFGKADTSVKDMDVKWLFKDATLESLTDEKFLQIAREAMPGIQVFHEEFDAAKAVQRE